MSTAKQKLKLLRFVVDADDETTEKLLLFTHRLTACHDAFSKEEVAFLKKGGRSFSNPAPLEYLQKNCLGAWETS